MRRRGSEVAVIRSGTERQQLPIRQVLIDSEEIHAPDPGYTSRRDDMHGGLGRLRHGNARDARVERHELCTVGNR